MLSPSTYAYTQYMHLKHSKMFQMHILANPLVAAQDYVLFKHEEQIVRLEKNLNMPQCNPDRETYSDLSSLTWVSTGEQFISFWFIKKLELVAYFFQLFIFILKYFYRPVD